MTQRGRRFDGVVVRLLLVGLLMLSLSAVASEDPAPQTRGSESANESENPPSSFSNEVQVTAVTTSMVAFDKEGKVVLDLRPDELLVLEDGEPVEILELHRGLAADESPAELSSQPPVSGEQAPTWQPWRVVVYVNTELAGRFALPSICRRAGEESVRLAELGPVEVVLADPSPHLVSEAGTNPEQIQRALTSLARDTSGHSTVEQIRNGFAREFRPGVGFDQRYTITQVSPATMVARVRASIHRERAIIRGELDRMMAWMQNQPPTKRGLLLWMTGGFDLNPAEFYVPFVEQVDSYMAQNLRADYTTLSLEDDVREVVEVALANGWTMMPLSASQTRFLAGAEVGGTGKVQHHNGVGAGSIESQAGEFRQVEPDYPLRVMAEGTGGEFVGTGKQFSAALDNAKASYALTYQVNRAADGRLHRLHVGCSRPDVKIRGRRFVASGSLRGVATTRARRLLTGEELEGDLVMGAEIRNITQSGKGVQTGDLLVMADVSDLQQSLAVLGLGEMRVTVVVEIEDSAPFVHHQEVELNWDDIEGSWFFSTGIRWPKDAKKIAVVVEELVSSVWGAQTIELR